MVRASQHVEEEEVGRSLVRPQPPGAFPIQPLQLGHAELSPAPRLCSLRTLLPWLPCCFLSLQAPSSNCGHPVLP